MKFRVPSFELQLVFAGWKLVTDNWVLVIREDLTIPRAIIATQYEQAINAELTADELQEKGGRQLALPTP